MRIATVASTDRINEVGNYYKKNKMYKTKRKFGIQESTVQRYLRDYKRINPR
jgi:hypothetical protein